jgi:DNA helicase-2/ATP-dependent DNA helicase PcrA
VSLLTDQDQKNDDTTQRVTLMTVHASKGLEYKHVFVVGMEEELFPSSRVLNSERELEEERRLFYVAITRAKETCHISYAISRFRNGKSNFSNPSRFINDIDPQFLILPQDIRKPSFVDNKFKSPLEERFFSESTKKTPTMQPFQAPKNLKKIAPAAPTTNFSTEVGGLCKGALVEHAIFGKGVIVELSGSGTDVRAIVDFEHVGQKNLLLKYAKLNVL